MTPSAQDHFAAWHSQGALDQMTGRLDALVTMLRRVPSGLAGIPGPEAASRMRSGLLGQDVYSDCSLVT
ncbi:hypothetical protein LHJ74_06900 [Streptomyces sp. N2-109]|uniref:Uncharacterized protein n=1 Tax=Streptomyces gossypii TaxID=2883101 RepID=A0ABT2JP44_9ACTN|nr:hypothetical protein [Streptomyces gossypii]MCT2589652.1 hypothetical protein [Streptomyces gossypii]